MIFTGKGVTTTALIILFLMHSGLAHAQSQRRGTASEAIEMVKRVKKMYLQLGAARTFRAVNARSNGFRKGDLYPFIAHRSGYVVAHFIPALRGQNALEYRDSKGRVIFNTIFRSVLIKKNGKEIRKKSGWSSYWYFNPVSRKEEQKSTYTEWLDDEYVVCVGIYGVVRENNNVKVN